LNHVEHCWTPHDFLVLFQTERRIELHQAGKKSDSGTIFRLDNWWNGVWIRFLQKNHLAYKKLPGGYIFFLGGMPGWVEPTTHQMRAGINPCWGLGYGVENGTNGTNISVVGPDGHLKQSQSQFVYPLVI
jgi:hypothetical protein